ncbi:MAG: hypothetical protein QOD44_1523 [Solirubrobacteraceae bacterium]|nr:hypothetical protein [Solirubrobacteraceae bacterium]
MVPSPTAGAARPRTPRSRATRATAALCAASAALLLSAAPSGAAITTGPIAPTNGFPFSYTDTANQFSLQQCQDASGFCIETPRPNPAQPITVPGNFTPDEEGFWWLADATIQNAGIGLARFGKEAAFDTDGINQGHQVAFSRIRFRFGDLVPGATYRITHPYGVDEIKADAGGIINSTNDVGCLAAPCGTFPAIAGDRITSFLQWDGTAPAPPAGYIGNGVTPHTVIGSPFGTNFVRLERLTGGVPELVGETKQFIVQGKLAGPPPPPAAHAGLNVSSLAFGTRQVGTTSTPSTVTVTNHGTAGLAVSGVALNGTDPSDFAIQSDGCTGQTVAPGASCSIVVAFAPGHAGDLTASLTISDDAVFNPQNVSLSGSGVGTAPGAAAAAVPAPAAAARPPAALVPGVVVAGTVARSLGLTGIVARARITRARVRRRGLEVAMTLPAGTQVVRFAVYRARESGRRVGRALAIGYRVPAAAGRYRLRLRSRALVRRLTPGRYVVLLTPGTGRRALGRTSTVRFTVTR